MKQLPKSKNLHQTKTSMGKFKIRKSAAKRFKITGTGKVMFGHQMQRHLKRKKSASNLRKKAIMGQMKGKFAKKIKMMIGEA